MAVRIQLRRDTAENWGLSNPVLREGELGIETDTLKIKIGNGTPWNSITNYANVVPSDLNTTLDGYVTVNDIGAQGGVVGLNNSYNAIIPGASIILEGPTADSYETTLTVTNPTEDRTITFPNANGTVALTSDISTAISNLVDGAPGLLDTLNELAAAVNDDPAFFTTVATNLSNHEADTTNIHGITDTAELATKSYADTAEADAITAAGTAAASHSSGSNHPLASGGNSSGCGGSCGIGSWSGAIRHF
jgi:hypothetical protein